MDQRPKTPTQQANDLLVKVNLSQIMKESGKAKPLIDDLITEEIDLTKRNDEGR